MTLTPKNIQILIPLPYIFSYFPLFYSFLATCVCVCVWLSKEKLRLRDLIGSMLQSLLIRHWILIKLYTVASKSCWNLKCCLRYNFNDSKYSAQVDSEIVLMVMSLQILSPGCEWIIKTVPFLWFYIKQGFSRC
jgi:hypothetical protein